MLFNDDKKAILECLLFVADEPLSIAKLSEIMELGLEDIMLLIEEMQSELQKPKHGLELIQVADGFRLTTKPQLFGNIEKLYKPKATVLSQAALETLAIIAYKQPITRAEIEMIRGVKADGVLTNLMERNLVQEVGRKDSPGKPILYGTTVEFLSYFGLKKIEELPKLEELNSLLHAN
ncbi:SMC-Scp complex subunit ScpB [Bacillota bacterium LX-D]|nr:SMC-Scp complex subunit ScpB [Bacillota bacterium LX-D]